MKNVILAGVLSSLSVVGTIGIMAPARAAGESLPVGTIIAWGGKTSSIPTNWMLCNGNTLSKAVFRELFAAIGTSWGSSGDQFKLPDLRGRFLRGDDAGTGRDPDAKKRKPCNPGGSATGVGSTQEDSLQNHKHDQTPHSHQFDYCNSAIEAALAPGYDVVVWDTEKAYTNEVAVDIKGVIRYNTKSKISAGEETRPKNAAVHFIIKVR